MSCKKKQDDINSFYNNWQLKSYQISYYNHNNQKVFEESPLELEKFNKIILSDTSIILVGNLKSFVANTISGNIDHKVKTSDVTLSSFSGKYNFNEIELRWSTLSENNNAYFIVERSSDGINFSNLVNIQGAGTTNQPNHYKYSDGLPLKGPNIYRLKMVNYAGENRFSNIIMVNFGQIPTNEYKFFKNSGKYYLPFPLYADKFSVIEMKQPSNTTLIFESTENNVAYLKDLKQEWAFSAKLIMEFEKL